MKEKLLQLANEKGYFSNFYNVEYYLWLCSLQNWLRNNHNIHIFIQPHVAAHGNVMSFYGRVWNFNQRWLASSFEFNDDYTILFEALCFEALNLIKN
jgi:hypothetical protein